MPNITSDDIVTRSVCTTRDGKPVTVYRAFHRVDWDDPEGIGKPLLVLYDERRDGVDPEAESWASIIQNEMWDEEQRLHPDQVYGISLT